jgi:tRNA(fMet)-specific endonuclease VapC
VGLYLLDTDILSLLQQKNVAVTDAVGAARRGGHELALSIVTVEEQTGGWLNALRGAKSPERHVVASRSFAAAVSLWGEFRIVPETVTSLDTLKQLLRAKLNVRKNDLRIASVALDLGAKLVTHNLVDFRRVANLSIEDWAVAPTVPPAPS